MLYTIHYTIRARCAIYANIFAYAFFSLSFRSLRLASTSFNALMTPPSPGTNSSDSFRSFSAPSSSLIRILPWALRYRALPFSAGDKGVMLRARDESETARLPAGGVHLSAAREALVNNGSRLIHQHHFQLVYSQRPEGFNLLGGSIVRKNGV